MSKPLTFIFSDKIDPLMIAHIPSESGINCPKCKRECRTVCDNCMATICRDCNIVFRATFDSGYTMGHRENCGIPREVIEDRKFKDSMKMYSKSAQSFLR